ncbi:MAG: FG-GAP-like repeat-containing protein, partial [bacterium]
MKYAAILLLIPTLICAQEFEFELQPEAFPVEIDGWQPFCPWVGGFSESAPDFCDIDADGDLDLFVGYYLGGVGFTENVGSSSIAHFQDYICQFDSLQCVTLGGRSNPDFGDLDSDGDLDAIVGGGYVNFIRNLGTTTQPNFTAPRDTLRDTSGNWVFGTNIALIDIDLDGDFDLIGGEYQGHLQFYRNIGTPDSFSYFLEDNYWLGISVGNGDEADPTFCDLDADNDLDLFIGEENGRIWYYRNDGDSVNYDFTYVTNYYDSIDVGGYASPEFADIDGDGDYDLFVGREQVSSTIDPGDIFFYENVGTPQVAQWRLVTRNYLCLDVGLYACSTTSDVDADLDHDLFIQHTGDYLSYYENIGSTSSASYLWVTDSYQDISVNDAYPKFCDIDGDGDADLFMGEAAIPGPPGLYLFHNQGTPQAAHFVLYSSNLIPGVFTQGSVSLAPSLADIDADGDQDLFICDTDSFYFFPNVGSPFQPQFGPPTYNWQNLVPPAGQSISCWYDIDEDGDLDFFWATQNAYYPLWFFRNDGTMQNAQLVLESENFLPAGGLPVFSGIDIFDIDQDGDGDFLLSTISGG